ncbi:ribosomal protein S7 domain-containing protein [Infundibulicybe gibba]|nr:ribosomal protein S7 domain-containing protein [Infundibulicybe gibba]
MLSTLRAIVPRTKPVRYISSSQQAVMSLPGAGPSAPPVAPTAPHLMNIPPPQDPLLHYITSSLLTHGHRARASRITSETLLHIHALTRAPPLPILRHAVFAAAPAVRTLMHRQSGKTVPRPVALGEKQRVRYARNRPGRTVQERLAREIVAAVQGNSDALKKKEEAHKFAMVNRGNAQTRV